MCDFIYFLNFFCSWCVIGLILLLLIGLLFNLIIGVILVEVFEIIILFVFFKKFIVNVFFLNGML